MQRLTPLIASLLLAASALGPAAFPGQAQSEDALRDQDAALEAREAGRLLSLGDIRSNVAGVVGGKFLGCDCDPHAARYRMKFLREGKVVMVDVDARTGNILRINE
ncbi:PepSY domain-containing protein [Pacificimonas flava]|uniref:PepSY domain-containing protein n=1 Tax=Pacificimonas flava TaxID=1234595 RepID=M2TKL0_9SPHN|nr:PepSY domain-containing protein [Pacificimonas flava]EMD82206.1 hypothetical protein C725_2492 [Pacificimonas flava]MBB5280316.1 putative membrane protein YkoI [Pacificimonas flava]